MINDYFYCPNRECSAHRLDHPHLHWFVRHGFDLTNGACTASAVTAIGLFLNEIHESAVASGAADRLRRSDIEQIW